MAAGAYKIETKENQFKFNEYITKKKPMFMAGVEMIQKLADDKSVLQDVESLTLSYAFNMLPKPIQDLKNIPKEAAKAALSQLAPPGYELKKIEIGTVSSASYVKGNKELKLSFNNPKKSFSWTYNLKF